MAWPTPQEYSEAVQNPLTNFQDPELREGTLAVNQMGLPIVASGSFASVYRIACRQKYFAVRCFLKHVPEQHARYERISKFVMTDTLPYTVDFNYISQGVLVRGTWYPLLKMDWVDGVTLDSYVRANLSAPKKLSDLAEKFKIMMRDLQAAGIAHGDLQHGNILVTKNGELRLVDYDGMFVPELEGAVSGEIGHRNYQHPGRDGTIFDAAVDNFSAWSIYTSLVALSIDPTLADRMQACDECLLFRQGDYRYPLSSRAFGTLEKHANEQIVKLSRTLRTLVSKPISEVPALGSEVEVPADLPAVVPSEEAPYALPPVITRVARPHAGGPPREVDLDLQMRQAWPSLNDYMKAVTNPAKNFLDPSMHEYILLRDHGAIRAQGTDHGAVFRFQKPDAGSPPRKIDVIVKVFLKADELIEHRYKSFFTYLHGGAVNYTELVPHFADFTFIPDGLRVGQKFFPIVRMKYVKGKTLFETVELNREDKTRMRELTHDFVKTMALIESSGIVHGDIEPENIIVKHDRLVLLDYDLLTVPNSRALASAVAANKHYRHPRLPAGTPIPNDNFAAWIMYYSLKIISLYPQIWNIAGAKPGRLLFHADDLKRPESSSLFNLLRSHYSSEVRAIADEVIALCHLQPQEIKPLRVSVRVHALDVLDALSNPTPATTKLTLKSLGVGRQERKRMFELAALGTGFVALTVLSYFPGLFIGILIVLLFALRIHRRRRP